MNHAQLNTRYKAWADDVFLSAISALPTEALTTPQPIIFGNLIRTLNHVCMMDHVWRCHLLGQPHGLTTRNPEPCPALEELATRQREMDAWYVHYADQMSDIDLAKKVTFDFIGGGSGRMSRLAILLHVVNHGCYHRGHVAGMLYQSGVAPPTTDLPVFLREQSQDV
ncbi:MAG: DinB family protein [Rhodanobacter sp.]